MVATRPWWQAVLLAGLFFGPAAAGWAWFNVAPQRNATSYEIRPRAPVAGFRFEDEPVDSSAIEILQTTNLINGSFIGGLDQRVTVFMGDWREKSARQMSVIQHTPDICWVRNGWNPVKLGQPDTLDVELGGVRIPFECRVYQMPGSAIPELTIWCALASGQVLHEGGQSGAAGESRYEREAAVRESGRRRAATTFLGVVKDRIPADGRKQFVRLSAPVRGDWRLAAAELRLFSAQWLELLVSHPGG